MKNLTLLIILVFGAFTGTLLAQNSVSSSDYLEVTCTIVDSTGAEKDVFAVNEPATYVLSIKNISDFPISYRYSSELGSLYSVTVRDYYMVDNNKSTVSPYVLDQDGVLEVGQVLKRTETASMEKPGKYQFVVYPNFNFNKQYWPETGRLYRVFNVIGSE